MFLIPVRVVLTWLMFSGHVYCQCHNETNDSGHFYRTHCGLQEVPHNIPKIVTHVFLSNNNITIIKPNAFSKLNKCTFLALSKNHLSKITQQMFSGLASVEILFLDNNQIFYIEYEAFSTLSRLVDVRLDSNNLTLIPAEVFGVKQSHHPIALNLSLDANALVCNWKIGWVKKAEKEAWLNLYNTAGNLSTMVNCSNYPNTNWNLIPLSSLEEG